MKILVVSQYFWPESFRINDLVLGLKERGHEVTVLTGIPNYPSGRFFPGYGFLSPLREEFKGVRVLRVPLFPRGGGKGWRLALNYLSFVFFASLLSPWRCRGRYDLIFVYEPSPITVGIPAIVLKTIKRIPIMFWVQDLWPESLVATGAVRSQFILQCVGKLVRFIYRRCDQILVQSVGFISRVVAAGAEPGRIQVLPNWAELLYRPVDVPEDAPEKSELPRGFLVMFAGNIGAAQSFETILGAAERLINHKDIHWVILGNGHLRSWVKNEITRCDLAHTVHLLGQRALETMPSYFALADVLLVTLRKNPFFALTIPSKIQSYLACARPIVAALDGEGAKVISESGAGLVCPAGDSEALANAVLALYRMSPQEREKMGKNGRTYFEAHFERECLLDRLELWAQELKQSGLCAS